MKEKIYTIPITDALKEADFCPFCYMEEKLYLEAIDYTIGSSYMESDVREKTDELGFCKSCYEKLLERQNKLGIALISHTHTKKLIKDIEALYKSDSPKKKSLFSKNDDSSSPLVDYIDRTSKSCFVCEKANGNFDRYIDSFFHLFEKDETIKELFINSKGVCYSHLSHLLKISSKTMKDSVYNEFKTIIIEKELSNLKTIEEDLEFFIKKFDYQYSHIPLGDKKDILERTQKVLK